MFNQTCKVGWKGGLLLAYVGKIEAPIVIYALVLHHLIQFMSEFLHPLILYSHNFTWPQNVKNLCN